MKVVVAMDSFKGSLSSMEAGRAAMRGIRRACDAEVVVRPTADGGEGTTEALTEGLGGTFRSVRVTGPMGESVEARYAVLPDGRTAVMEMAEAAGIVRVPRGALDPRRASTVGVGEMILDAVAAGCRDFILGIGGSATTEAGIGMLSALGFDFLDARGEPLPPGFESLAKVETVRAANVPAALDACRFQVACDVNNPLCGPMGAVRVFGPQKGVRPDEMAEMDAAVARFAGKVAAFAGRDCAALPGAGAAGGLGFALMSCLPNVTLRPGVDIVLDAVGLERDLRGAEIVVTGEGRMDGQTAMGKLPVGVARLARRHGCLVIAFAGGVAEDAERCNDAGIDAFFPIVRGVTTLDEAMRPEIAARNLERAAEQAFRLLRRAMTRA